MMLQRESEVFRAMFTLPISERLPCHIEGATDDHPIRLPDISDVDFRNLLSYLYPL